MSQTLCWTIAEPSTKSGQLSITCPKVALSIPGALHKSEGIFIPAFFLLKRFPDWLILLKAAFQELLHQHVQHEMSRQTNANVKSAWNMIQKDTWSGFFTVIKSRLATFSLEYLQGTLCPFESFSFFLKKNSVFFVSKVVQIFLKNALIEKIEWLRCVLNLFKSYIGLLHRINRSFSVMVVEFFTFWQNMLLKMPEDVVMLLSRHIDIFKCSVIKI